MGELIDHARRIGKKGVILRYGVVLFGGVLVAASVVRYWIGHDLALAAFLSRDFGELLLAGMVAAPLLGAVWGWGVWHLLTWSDTWSDRR